MDGGGSLNSNLDNVLLTIDSEQIATEGNSLDHPLPEAHKLPFAQEDLPSCIHSVI